MSNIVVKNLLAILDDNPIAIWGARMTGIGFFRFAKKHNLNAVAFIDSDQSLGGASIYGLPVSLPKTLASLKQKHENLKVVVAVSIKEDEIIDMLNKTGMSSNDCIIYKKFCKHFFTIDIVGACNLKCPSCARSMREINNPKGLMPLEDFKKITEKCIKEVGLVSHISLYNWGEPLLHPELDSFIDYAHQKGIATAVSTNLSIAKDNQLEKLVKSSPDYLKISLSGYYPDTYNQTHTGGDVNLVKSNLYRLKYYIEKHNASFLVDVNYHLYKNNIDQDLTKMGNLCKELGFIFSNCYANFTPVERIIQYCQGKLDKRTQEFFDLLLIDLDKGLQITKPFHHLPCRFFLNQVNINWDRSVALCCVSYDRKTSIVCDDFLKEPLADIEKNKENRDICKTCSGYGIHQYLLGVNQKEWKKEAEKHIK
tara:strand:+ start:1704 stop:2975 length:1272 start_codon:yes stop_codon:yes gene_type:complete